jgi:hypothetical protein
MLLTNKQRKFFVFLVVIASLALILTSIIPFLAAL